MKSRTAILREARKQLRKLNIPVEGQEERLHLLKLLLSEMGEALIQNEDFSTLLLETILNNGNLLTIIEHQAAELDALKHITRNLTSTLDIQVVLDQVVQEAMYLIRDSHEAHIYLHEDGALVFGAALDEHGTKNKQVSVPRRSGMTNLVVRKKQRIVIEDMETHALFTNAPKKWKGSIIGIPLMMGERVVGVMNLVRSRKGEFTQPEIRLLTMLADQAALAINNANLHQKVTQQARSDTVTRLPNRRALDERLDEAIRQADLSGLPFGVVMMDLDGFKAVNDTFGHETGDNVLRQIADGLKKSLRGTDFLARYGGDEITLVLPDTDLLQAINVSRKIQSRLQTLRIRVPDVRSIRMGVSGGIAIYPRHADNAPGMLRAADAALYQAKKHARGTFMTAPNRTGELQAPLNLNSDR